MSVVIDPGEVNCFCGCVMNFMMFLAYFRDNNQDIITSINHSVFIKQSSKSNAMVTVHVDDMVAVVSNSETLAYTFTELCRVINVIDMGPIKWFLSIKSPETEQHIQFPYPRVPTSILY